MFASRFAFFGAGIVSGLFTCRFVPSITQTTEKHTNVKVVQTEDNELFTMILTQTVENKLLTMINKYSSNISLLSATQEAKELALQIGKFGLPSYSNLRFYDSYCSSINYQRRIPNWTAEYLTLKNIQGEFRKRCNFRKDNSIPPLFRSINSNYQKSVYDRGHLVAAANHNNSEQAKKDTFILTSNIVPQDVFMNRSQWASLEYYVRNLIKSGTYSNCWIISGPVFKPVAVCKENTENQKLVLTIDLIGEQNVTHVPTHLFKIVLAQKKDNNREYYVYSWIMANQQENAKKDLKEYTTSLQSVEKLTGLQFFPALFENDTSIRVSELFS